MKSVRRLNSKIQALRLMKKTSGTGSSFQTLQEEAARVFNGDLNTFIDNVRKTHTQIIDTVNPDQLTNVGWDKHNREKAEGLILDFGQWIARHKDEITALQIFYDQPWRRRELTYTMIKEVLEKIRTDKPLLAPLHVWRAYEAIGQVSGSPANELIALVSLIRKACRMDEALTPYDKTVDRNFQAWVMNRHKGNAPKFNDEQMEWLRMIKEHVATSIHIEKEDLDFAPFDAKGGAGKMWQLFGSEMDGLINELNEVLVA